MLNSEALNYCFTCELNDLVQIYFLNQNQNTGELTSVTNMCKMRALHCLLELRQDEVVQKLCGQTIEDLRWENRTSSEYLSTVRLLLWNKTYSTNEALCVNKTKFNHRNLLKTTSYLIALEKLHILHSVETFESSNKEGLIKGIWRNHSHQKSVRLCVCWIIVGSKSLLYNPCNVLNHVFDFFRPPC